MPDGEAGPPATQPVRALTADIVSRWRRSGVFPERLLPDRHPERALLMELVYGVVRHQRALEHLLAPAVRTAPDPLTGALLLTGAYQIFYMDGIPPHAIVSETVAAARAVGLDARRAGFVNAVLRTLLRRRAALQAHLAAAPLAVRESHPDLLIARWSRCYGPATAEALAAWNNTRPPVAIRVNTLHVTSDALRGQLAAAGIDLPPHPDDWPAAFILLPPGTRIETLPGYADGLFHVQDPATDEAVRLLDAQPGEHILDACAAPGGKTLALAAALGDRGRITALDASAARLVRLRENIARARVPRVTVVRCAADAPEKLPATIRRTQFDRILLDVPCTNTGVLRRRPDARWRFSTDSLRQACELQARLLETAAPLLRSGGRLVYSTCSLEPEENADQIDRFLERHPTFRLADHTFRLPPAGGTDGAYAAALTA